MDLNRYSKRTVTNETSTKQIISYFTSQQEASNTKNDYHQKIFDYPDKRNSKTLSFVPNCIQQPPSIPTLQNAWRKHNLPNFALTIKGVGGGGGNAMEGNNQFQIVEPNGQFHNMSSGGGGGNNQVYNSQFQNNQIHGSQSGGSQNQNNQYGNYRGENHRVKRLGHAAILGKIE